MPISTSKGVGTLYYDGKPLMELTSIDFVTIAPDDDVLKNTPVYPIEFLNSVETSFSVKATPETVRAFNRIIHTHQDLPRMTRKRFMKRLMGYGWSRNAARNIAAYYHKLGMSWAEAWQDCKYEIWPGVSFILGPRGLKEECP